MRLEAIIKPATPLMISKIKNKNSKSKKSKKSSICIHIFALILHIIAFLLLIISIFSANIFKASDGLCNIYGGLYATCVQCNTPDPEKNGPFCIDTFLYIRDGTLTSVVNASSGSFATISNILRNASNTTTQMNSLLVNQLQNTLLKKGESLEKIQKRIKFNKIIDNRDNMQKLHSIMESYAANKKENSLNDISQKNSNIIKSEKSKEHFYNDIDYIDNDEQILSTREINNIINFLYKEVKVNKHILAAQNATVAPTTVKAIINPEMTNNTFIAETIISISHLIFTNIFKTLNDKLNFTIHSVCYILFMIALAINILQTFTSILFFIRSIRNIHLTLTIISFILYLIATSIVTYYLSLDLSAKVMNITPYSSFMLFWISLGLILIGIILDLTIIVKDKE